jgi:hypothetical protein
VARYGAGITKAGVNTAATTLAVLWSPTNEINVRRVSITISVVPTTAPDLYLVLATARGTQTTTQAGALKAPKPGPAAVATVDSVWSVAPTVGAATTAWERIALPLTAGAGVIFTYEPNECELINGTGLAIVNAAASGATLGSFSFGFAWEE